MNNESMLSIQGDMVVGVKADSSSLSILDLVRLKKLVIAESYDPIYDFNDDGVLDDLDLAILRRTLLEN